MSQKNKSWKIAGKKDEHVDSRLSGDRDEKGQEHAPGTIEEIVDGDRKGDDKPVHQSIEKNLRDQKRVGAPNEGATGLVEKRLNEAKTTLYPHRNEEAWARTGEKRPINALPEELGKASDEKKRERWNDANKSGAKRILDKDVGKQLDLPKTTIRDKSAFNLHQKKVAALKPYEKYLSYKGSKAGGWSDKFASVRAIDARLGEIMSKNAALSKEQKDEVDVLKREKLSLLGIGKFAGYYTPRWVDKKMNHAEYQAKLRSMDENAIRFILKDAKEAIESNPNGPNAGYYQDEISYAAMELKKRREANRLPESFEVSPGRVNRGGSY